MIHQLEPGQTGVERDAGQEQREQKQRRADKAEGGDQAATGEIAEPAATVERHAGLGLGVVQAGQSAGAEDGQNETHGRRRALAPFAQLRVVTMQIGAPPLQTQHDREQVGDVANQVEQGIGDKRADPSAEVGHGRVGSAMKPRRIGLVVRPQRDQQIDGDGPENIQGRLTQQAQ